MRGQGDNLLYKRKPVNEKLGEEAYLKLKKEYVQVSEDLEIKAAFIFVVEDLLTKLENGQTINDKRKENEHIAEVFLNHVAPDLLLQAQGELSILLEETREFLNIKMPATKSQVVLAAALVQAKEERDKLQYSFNHLDRKMEKQINYQD